MTTVRIHITGASGCGISTLGRAVSERIGGVFLDTDDFYWQPTDPPYQLKFDPAERLRRVRAAVQCQSRWVLAGSLMDWGDPLIPLFDLVVFLFTPTAIRLARLRARERERFGEALAPGGPMHHAHEAFIKWAAAYDDGSESGRSLPRHKVWLAALPGPVLKLDGARRVPDLADQVLAFFADGRG